MRIYTNFDLWNALKFHHGLGKVIYQEVDYDLDQEEGLRHLLVKLIKDGVVEDEGWDTESGLNWSSQIPLKWSGELEFLNQTNEGKVGKMQLGTLMLNLIEAKILIKAPKVSQ